MVRFKENVFPGPIRILLNDAPRSPLSFKKGEYNVDGEEDDEDFPDEDDPLAYQKLRHRVAELRSSNTAAAATRRILNDRLQHTQSELRTTKLKCADLESRVRALSHFESAYEREVARVEQLERSLEEQRRFINGAHGELLMSPAMRVQSPDATMIFEKHQSKFQEEYDRGKSLMAELELVLYSAEQLNDGAGPDALFQTLGSAANDVTTNAGGSSSGFGLDDFVGMVGAVFGGGNSSSTEPTTTYDPIVNVGQVATPAIRVSSTQMIEQPTFSSLLVGFASAAYKWFRFMCILWAAVMVAMYRGPGRKRITAQGEQKVVKTE